MKHSQKFLEKRKLLMVVPLLALPFITAAFWALGGGSGSPADTDTEQLRGLNLDLPLAHFSEEQLDKLSLYETARRDSLKFQEARDNDPYFKLENLSLPDERTVRQDPNELLVKNKLAELYRELNRKPSDEDHFANSGGVLSHKQTSLGTPTSSGFDDSEDLKQLDAMQEMMQSKRKTNIDPEENRINTMLDKILDIQHPERVRDKLQERSINKKGQVFAVASLAVTDAEGSSFFGLDDEIDAQDSVTDNAIEAVIHSTQELVAGATVKLRLLGDVYINGRLIPKDQFVFGTAGINGERLTISINSIRSDNSLFPVSLDAYDLDGLEGIYVPGAITRDAAKQSGDQAMQSMQFMTMDQSLGAQAGAAGIQAAKGLFSKKVKLVKVTVKAGYRVLLKDDNEN